MTGRSAGQSRGTMSHFAGHAAEDAVARDYERRGHRLVARCWRGSRGELDLVFEDGEGLIVVEVKQAPDFERALAHLGPAQLARIHATAEEFAATQPHGPLTELRFDVALVDGTGQMQFHENFWA
ncbi:MAG: YraN family protein [Maritimibacter sp.]|nr:YraN family protein [Maritimibacter sp.]